MTPGDPMRRRIEGAAIEGEPAPLPEIDRRLMARAIVQALDILSDRRYQRFLGPDATRELDAKWFQWFVREWRVARTIRAGHLEHVRQFLDGKFRRATAADPSGKAIDMAAAHIRDSGWSSRGDSGRNGVLPVSLVSKIAFLLCPSVFVPSDTYSRIGLSRVLTWRAGSALPWTSYEAYLAAFNGQFDRFKPLVRAEVEEPWASALADRLGCSGESIASEAMLRKVFDNYLMHIGGFLSDSPT